MIKADIGLGVTDRLRECIAERPASGQRLNLPSNIRYDTYSIRLHYFIYLLYTQLRG